MKVRSTRSSATATFEEAVLSGLAPDRGLYVPEHTDPLPHVFLRNLRGMSMPDIAHAVTDHLLGQALSAADRSDLVRTAISFDAPLVEVEPGVHALELFHGPTLAFKDYGARFLAGLLGLFARRRGERVTLLVATSGDTGGAVAHGFLGIPEVRVLVLYPKGKVSDLQEKQFTAVGGNVTALAVNGTFDDCQRLVKTAFADQEVRRRMFLASANSINIARLIPQMFYYFRAVAQLPSDKPVVFSVPSGNFGNLTAGVMAHHMGVRVHRFLAATNVNATIPEFLESGTYSARPGIQTMSNAMDVGDPSNFERMRHLLGQDARSWSSLVSGYSFSDEQTASVMRDVFHQAGYVLDPHGAVGYLGLKRWMAGRGGSTAGVFLETAHPAKFRSAVEDVLGVTLELPPALAALEGLTGSSVPMTTSYAAFQEFLLRTG